MTMMMGANRIPVHVAAGIIGAFSVARARAQ